eukprot:CAMPEP_0117442036 /NCGR_PEP_ID=MMETSP0759-20121206/3941_1 /TAXON_ID=63605 /ORGANISM="Percolomonas cosmopolitus, Strain WS" /LENGTH=454 /DNA_ID=CAMNT_0005233905 /DNA_START=142 /DNA_END=1506 /DNA_ORIENTATION=-
MLRYSARVASTHLYSRSSSIPIPVCHLHHNSYGTFNNYPKISGFYDTIILRDEVKPFEKRTPLLPKHVSILKQYGFNILVESSKTRIIPDVEYQHAGAKIIPSFSMWKPDSEARSNPRAVVLGLKELPKVGTKLVSSNNEEITVPDAIYGSHIYFAHIFKYQSGWKNVMQRFDKGDGVLMDLEFLVDDNLQRVAAFGGAAGYAGIAMGLLTWIEQQIDMQNGHHKRVTEMRVRPYASRSELIQDVQQKLEALGKKPKILIVGAAGRCGRGSRECLVDILGGGYADVLYWGRKETHPDTQPEKGIVDCDIVVNDIFAAGDMEPFITMEQIKNYPNRRFSVFVDVSCDITSQKKAFPLNSTLTTFDKPAKRVLQEDEGATKLPLDVVAIDNLPTLIPSYSSRQFAESLFEYLLELKNVDFDESSEDIENTNEAKRVWLRAREKFERKKKEALWENL